METKNLGHSGFSLNSSQGTGRLVTQSLAGHTDSFLNVSIVRLYMGSTNPNLKGIGCVDVLLTYIYPLGISLRVHRTFQRSSRRQPKCLGPFIHV